MKLKYKILSKIWLTISYLFKMYIYGQNIDFSILDIPNDQFGSKTLLYGDLKVRFLRCEKF